jgi:tetratricopeptide (TPR) repeat protein
MIRKAAWLASIAAAGLASAPVGADSMISAADMPALAWCAQPADTGGSDAKPPPAPPPQLIEGLGYAGIVPDTANPEARRWFEQGVRWVWAFDEAEGIRAFAEAQRLDPQCAMCWWGEAWARSPTINLQRRTEEFAAAKAAMAKAAALAGKLGPAERALIGAMQVRTAGATDFDAKAYARSISAAATLFPRDDAIAVMAADAEMQVSDARKLPQGTAAQRRLETVLARSPNHSGAIHFYIHLTDWIEQEKLAEPYASRLAALAPGASHLVHMPSHTFFGVGRYGDAMRANLSAIAIDKAYADKVRPPPSDYRAALGKHNTHFAIVSALSSGDAAASLKTAEYFRTLFGADDAGNQFVRASIWFAYGRHAPLNDVLALPEPPEKAPVLRAMRHYARGEALARSGDAKGVRAEAATVAHVGATMQVPPQAAAPAEAMIGIAAQVLEGRAAMIDGDFKAAESAFRAAMKLQKKARFSSDPPTWWYPVRRSLAAALLARGEHRSARLQLLATLKHWPDDPVSLTLLAQAERGLGRAAEARAAEALAARGWSGEAVPLSRA